LPQKRDLSGFCWPQAGHAGTMCVVTALSSSRCSVHELRESRLRALC
jgi:hypothetical protein